MTKRNSDKKTTRPTPATTPALPLAPTMTVSIEMIGPVEATALLATNTRNRTVNQKHVDEIATAMTAGTYAPSPQSISQLADGTLGDGQHRLLAIIKSGKTYPMVVARNVPVAARDVIDTGFAVRGARHALQIADGVTIATTEASALTAIIYLKHQGRLTGSTPPINTAMLRQVREDHGEDVRKVASVVCHGNKMRSAAFVASLAIARRTHPDLIDRLCTHLRDMAGLTADHPALRLRDYVMETRNGGAATRDVVSLKTFAAIEAFRQGRSLKKLYEGPDARAKYLAPWCKPDEA